MRISDCSDVCSSDLADIGPYLQGRRGKGDDPFQRQTPQPQGPELGLPGTSFRAGLFHHHLSEAEAGEKPLPDALPYPVLAENLHRPPRQEDRRVAKARVTTCTSRCPTHHEKQ